jgi:hypothetical protein
MEEQDKHLEKCTQELEDVLQQMNRNQTCRTIISIDTIFRKSRARDHGTAAAAAAAAARIIGFGALPLFLGCIYHKQKH